MTGVDRGFKPNPYKYAQAIDRRIGDIEGVHHTNLKVFGRPGSEKAHVLIKFVGETHRPGDELVDAVDQLRREFSSAFPDWGISVDWTQYTPTRVVKVARTFIAGSRLVQELECGHTVDGGKIKVKRVCTCCAGEIR